jgi:hypothetical protein
VDQQRLDMRELQQRWDRRHINEHTEVSISGAGLAPIRNLPALFNLLKSRGTLLHHFPSILPPFLPSVLVPTNLGCIDNLVH